ncbi:uncharacterized protein LOC100572639 isoform X2 [Acyrthosiphon pisum]|uniref:Uncharacterized protein n=1 Tax=Acyrthosiphon pisum TaxID=7029 RepID=A0A8R2D1B1_ACYPI|nr:uncharacterized protein LOC100572639 isoform X2 [Acyrthosiphon pisum]|eukprot:XP_016656342.1 PREDICTED: uncharacterized protein LOC100572639 isoform X2 [Acyrthosiphon pisum]
MAIRLCIFNSSMITDSSSIVKATFQSLLLLFLLCLIIYFNNKLKKAAFVHNILFIRQWLMFHCTFYTLSSTLLFYCLFTYPCKIIIATAVIIIVMEIYQIHIVKRFYNNELEHLATSNCNIDKQSVIPIFPRGY